MPLHVLHLASVPLRTMCEESRAPRLDCRYCALQSKKTFNLDQLFRAIELEKMKSMDESRSPIERTKSMRVRL